LVAALQTGEADFLIGPLRDSALARDVVQEQLFDDPLSIIVRANHPLAKRKRLTAADLVRLPWIAPRAGSRLRLHFDALFEFAGISAPERTVECNSLSTARAFLLASNRMMLLSAHQIHHELKTGLLATIAHPAGRIVRPIGLTLRRG
jgi:LysR family transcriptional regulator, regulator for genes of the gallate degradation pathway